MEPTKCFLIDCSVYSCLSFRRADFLARIVPLLKWWQICQGNNRYSCFDRWGFARKYQASCSSLSLSWSFSNGDPDQSWSKQACWLLVAMMMKTTMAMMTKMMMMKMMIMGVTMMMTMTTIMGVRLLPQKCLHWHYAAASLLDAHWVNRTCTLSTQRTHRTFLHWPHIAHIAHCTLSAHHIHCTLSQIHIAHNLQQKLHR